MTLNSYKISIGYTGHDAFFWSGNGIWKCHHDAHASCEPVKDRQIRVAMLGVLLVALVK